MPHEENPVPALKVSPTSPQNPTPTNTARERRFATDWFMLFAYGLFTIAIFIQLALIIWLDLI